MTSTQERIAQAQAQRAEADAELRAAQQVAAQEQAALDAAAEAKRARFQQRLAEGGGAAVAQAEDEVMDAHAAWLAAATGDAATWGDVVAAWREWQAAQRRRSVIRATVERAQGRDPGPAPTQWLTFTADLDKAINEAGYGIQAAGEAARAALQARFGDS